MTDEQQTDTAADASAAFIAHLQETGFFDQLSGLEQSLTHIAQDLQAVGNAATQRSEETESLAAHVLAIEAVLAVMLRTYPIDPEVVKALIRDKTGATEEQPDGNPTVQAVAASIVGG